MKNQKIVELIRRNPSMHLATMDAQGNPRTRGMMNYSADERGITFHTGAYKDLYEEMKANPQVELCFLDPKSFTQIRVSGRVEELEDNDLRLEIINSPGREFMKAIVEKQGLEAIRVFRVAQGKVRFWDRATNHEYPKKEIPWENLFTV